MDFARYVNDGWVYLTPGRQIIEGEGEEAILHPYSIVEVWPLETLESQLNIKPIQSADSLPPDKLETSRHLIDNDGVPKWELEYDDPPPIVKSPKVSKIEFMRKLTPTELGRLNAARKMIAEIPAASYMEPTETQQQLIMLEVVLQMFELPELIELDHPDTAQGVGALALAGILDAPAMTRVQQILTP